MFVLKTERSFKHVIFIQQTMTKEITDNVEMPMLGLGTWQLTGDACRQSVKNALNIGYRHIDTAYHYGNHKVIGEAIKESEVDRSDIFVTTKIWRDHFTHDLLHEQFSESLDQLDMEYVDLLLAHWPNESVNIEETLGAMQELKEAGKVQAIGVSNFTINLLKDALATDMEVAVNQVEFHPSLNQKELKRFCDKEGITLTAYSPLGRGEDLSLDPVVEIAGNHGVSEAQVIIRWLNQKGLVAIPKASSRKHLKDNFQARELQLSDQEMERIENCDAGNRLLAPAYGPF